MSDPRSDSLTPDGQARRRAMLDDLVRIVERTHLARRRGRRALGVGTFVVLMSLMLSLAVPYGARTDGRRDRVQAPASLVCNVEVIQTDPSIVGRYRAKPTPRVVRIDDGALVAALASMGRPTGLIHFGDSDRLTAAVTDAELAQKH